MWIRILKCGSGYRSSSFWWIWIRIQWIGLKILSVTFLKFENPSSGSKVISLHSSRGPDPWIRIHNTAFWLLWSNQMKMIYWHYRTQLTTGNCLIEIEWKRFTRKDRLKLSNWKKVNVWSYIYDFYANLYHDYGHDHHQDNVRNMTMMIFMNTSMMMIIMIFSS